MLQVPCDYCDTQIKKYPSEIRKANFCSVLCRNRWLNNKHYEQANASAECKYCGTLFSFARSHNRRFCSKKCSSKSHSERMRGSNHPCFGKEPTKSTKQAISAAVRQYFAKNDAPWLGKHLPVDVRVRLSELALIRCADPEYRKKLRSYALSGLRSQHRRPNTSERHLEGILNKYFPGEWQYTGDGSHTIGGFAIDFTNCNGRKAVIEMFGDYWHNRSGLKWHQSELGRIMACGSLGFACLVIWEHELQDEEAIVSKIRQFVEAK